MSDDETKIHPHPADHLAMCIREITRTTPKREEGERLMDALEAYYHLSRDNKVIQAENKVGALKYSLKCAESEIAELHKRLHAQSKMLEATGVYKAINDLYHMLSDVSFSMRRFNNG